MKVNTLTIRNMIKSACNHDQRCANDYTLLIATIWYREGWIDPKLYDRLRSVTNPETIRRTFQKLRQEGEIVVDEKINEMRFKEMQQVRKDLL